MSAHIAEVRALRARIQQLEEELKAARAYIRAMVEKAADAKLDGYRELGQRVAKAEEERDAALAREAELREIIAKLPNPDYSDTYERGPY